MARASKSTAKFRPGDFVLLSNGFYDLPAVILEDRGLLTKRRVQFYYVRTLPTPGDSYPDQVTVPEERLTPAPPDWAARNPAAAAQAAG